MGFSFEFRKKLSSNLLEIDYSIPIGEYFFVNGPLNYSEVLKYRVTVEPTFSPDKDGQSAISDFGIDNGMLSLSGEFNIYFEERPVPKSFNIPFISSSTGLRSGEMEFQDFLGFLHLIRYDSYLPSGIDGAFLSAAFSGDNKFNHSEYLLIYNDYHRGRSIEVVPQQITITRGTDDNFTYKYQAQFIVVRDMNFTGGSLSQKLLRYALKNPFLSIKRMLSLANSIINIPLAITGSILQIGALYSDLKSTIPALKNSFDGMKPLFNEEGKLIKSMFAQENKEVSQKGAGYGFYKALEYNFTKEATKEDIIEALLKNNTEAPTIEGLGEAKKTAVELLSTFNGLILGFHNTTVEEEAIKPYADFSKLLNSDNYYYFFNLSYSLNQARASYTISNIDNSFRLVEAKGETFSSLASKELGDPGQGAGLAEYNNKDISFFLQGHIVRIPFGRKNEIFYKLNPKNISNTELEKAGLGEDLAVDQNRDFKVSSSGDLAIESGLSCYLSNIIDIIETPINSLPLHPDHGNPFVIGEIYDDVILTAYQKKIGDTIKRDNRTLSITQNKTYTDGDQLLQELEINSIFPGKKIKLRYSP